MLTIDFFNMWDPNYTGAVSFDDVLEDEEAASMVETCDSNADGNLEMCELHDCLVATDQAWEAQNCSNFTELSCDCPFAPPAP